jgi:uncharacterized protein YfaS (alpha-2-macroglobulin family)
MDEFSGKLKEFIQFARNNASPDVIKNEYLKLVKAYHPDTNKNVDFDVAHEHMIHLNYVYEHLLHKKTLTTERKTEDEYEKNMENGKYVFINDYGRKEYITDKSLYIYKLGLLKYQRCYKIMFSNSVFEGKGDESGYRVIKNLYECYLLARRVIEMDKGGMYGNMARILIANAYKMNENITKGLKTSSEKGIVSR